MFRNYLKTAWRNIIGQKWFSLINIFGLAIGMAASIMLYIYITYERSFDQFHPNKEKIYRVTAQFHGKTDSYLPRTFHNLGSLMTERSPLVSSFCRVKNESKSLTSGEEKFEGQEVLMVDETFTDFFNFTALAGNIKRTLSDPSGIVISSELAKKLFGDENPLGKVISYPKTIYNHEQRRFSGVPQSVYVGAVLAPMPENTHLQFDALISFEAYDDTYKSTFANDVFVFLMVEGDNPDLESITQISQGYYDDLGFSGRITNHLQKLTDIHFGQKFGYDIGPRGNLQLIIIFSLVALFIITIAVINFINLVTARSEKRAVEACIRKVSGAGKRDIFGQFLGESVLMSLLAFFLSMVLVELFLSPFSQLLGRQLTINPFESLSLSLKLVGIVIAIGAVAGMYPAILFSRYQPAEIMRGKFSGGKRNPLLRIVLVVVQFAISVILIVSITVFNRQVNHMKNSDLGFTPDYVITFSGLTSSIVNGYDALKAELLQNPNIIEVGSGQATPGFPGSGQNIRTADAPENQALSITEYRVREGYREAYELEIVEGEWFDFESSSDMAQYVVNQATVKALGLLQPVGQEVIMFNRPGKIIGVVQDFHFSSLQNKIAPLMFTAYSDAFYNIVVKTSGKDHPEVIDHIRKVFARFDPNYRPNELYVSDVFHSFYKQEEQQNTILNYASFLAVIIAMLGLLGLSSYIVMSRTKEIGIRKVMGASGLQITTVLFRDIGRWVILGNIAAWPLAWYAMEQWLNNYPYRIDMSASYLFLAGLISLFIAALTISGHTWRAATANPVDALKIE